MAHPHIQGVRQGAQQLAAVLNRQRRAAILPLTGLCHSTTQGLRHSLEAIADAEDRYPRVKQGRIQLRGTLRIDGGGPTGEDDGRWPPGQDLLDGSVRANDLRVDSGLPHAPGDELRVLGTEVDDENQVVLRSHGLESSVEEMPSSAEGPSASQALRISPSHMGIITPRSRLQSL